MALLIKKVRAPSMKLKRYDQLTAQLSAMACENILEVGTWNGRRARELASAALRRNPAVAYYGFDLFEELTDDELEGELSKRPPSRSEVEAGLREFQRQVSRRGALLPWRRRSFEFLLHQGNTRDTLPAFRDTHPEFRADFIFIDGGHKIETINNDWRHCSQLIAPKGVVFLDDYYDNKELTERFGCNRLIAELRDDPSWSVSVLPVTDTVPEIGTIRMVKVTQAQE